MEQYTTPQRIPRRVCDIPNCSSDSKKSPSLGFFDVATNPERINAWMEHIQRATSLKTIPRYICQKHFKNDEVVTVKTANNVIQKRLFPFAVPTIYPVAQSTKSSQCTDTPTNKHFSHRTSTAGHQPSKRTKVARTLNIFVNEDVDVGEGTNSSLLIKDRDFIPEEGYPAPRDDKPQKRKYCTVYKLKALELYYKSPFSYRVLRSSLKLPRISTLHRLFIPATAVLSRHMLAALQLKVNIMTPEQKQCVVCIGTLNLKPRVKYDAKEDTFIGFHEVNNIHILDPAKTALVVMVRGLFHNWKQALAYAYLLNLDSYMHTKQFIDEIVEHIVKIGLNVRAILSDLESDKLTCAGIRNVAAENPFILIDNKKIYYMHDPLYLMTSIRYQLVEYDFKITDNTIVSWNHVTEYYLHSGNDLTMRIPPQLSATHIIPVKDAFDELKITNDVFSKSTSAAMSAFIEMKILPESARATVEFILNMSQLIEMFSFNTTQTPIDKSAVTSGETESLGYLIDILLMFNTLRLVKRNDNNQAAPIKAKFIEPLKVTINAFLSLLKDLESSNFRSPIVGLSRDCLSEFFIKVRKKYGRYPTTEEMTKCITTFPIFNMFQFKNKKSPAKDLDTFLAHVRQMSKPCNIYEQNEQPNVSYVSLCGDVNFDEVALPARNEIHHIAKFLENKILEKHKNCDASYMHGGTCEPDTPEADKNTPEADKNTPEADKNTPEADKNTPEADKNTPKADKNTPEADKNTPGFDRSCTLYRRILNFTIKLEERLNDYFKENTSKPSIPGLLQHMGHVAFEMPCENFPLEYIKELYLRLRLHLIIKKTNNYLSDQPLLSK